MKIKLCLWSVLIVSLLGNQLTLADAIDDFVNAELVKQKIPGVAVAIIKDGEVQRAQGYGYANLEHRVPVHAETIFQSGSVGKQFTAVATLLMVEDGKLKLEDSIRTYFKDAPKWWQPITIRHLLTHTAGLAREPGFDLKKDYSDAELLKVIYQQPMDFPAGQRWSYSNTGYTVLGLLITQLSGQFYGDLLRERVFKPLGMHTARVISERDLIMHRAAGYEVDEKGTFNQEWVSPTANSTGDGSLYLSVLDYVKWDAAQLHGRILKPESWQAAWTPVRLNSGNSYPYGFGWGVTQGAGQNIVQHSGGWQGFQTHMIRYLGDKISVVVLANRAGANSPQIAVRVAELYAPKLAPPAGKPISKDSPQVTSTLKDLLMRAAAGKLQKKDFPQASTEELAGVNEEYKEQLSALGDLQELALFEQKPLGDDQSYRYRARYSNGLTEIYFKPSSNGAPDLQVSPIDRWDEPLALRED
jgi:CubicO group peptidase (beta-lactamase class C family)